MTLYEETEAEVIEDKARGMEVVEMYLYRKIWRELREEMIERKLMNIEDTELYVLGVKIVPVDLPDWIRSDTRPF